VTALTPPAMDAPAAEWGAFAVSIPGWRFPDGTHWAAPGFVASATGCSPVFDVAKYARAFFPVYPDPDHWAWEGWLLALLGPGWCWQHTDDGCIVSRHLVSGFRIGVWDRNAYRAPTLGRAAIAAAAAVTRWPGGEA
jgi:hypothetical protein